MDMTKFLSDQDPDYRNVLAELRRFVQSCRLQTKSELPLATSQSIESQGQPDRGTANEGSSTMERDQNTVHEEEEPYQPAGPMNTFSGTFRTKGGKMMQGNEFNSGGGSMTF